VAPPNRFAYCVLVGVGENEAEGRARADQVAGYVRTSPIVAEPFRNPPGYAPVAANVAAMRAGPSQFVARVQTVDGRTIDPTKASVQEFMDSRTVFAGTPDQVFEQIEQFNTEVGGLGHLIIMAQGGTLSYEETCANLKLFAAEVMPRLAELEMPENPYADLAEARAGAAE
jgi:alkanesulfonate monooxygenase SsuD/methylene tetrahydromethanopterin reductase-like flavin-dependent oxidoreductase (luciferase family)